MDMDNNILEYIRQVENKYDVDVLLVCETGSRAWGFASPDSDFDVRFIYRHRKEWYLSLTEGKDSIDLMYDDGNMDISGWELRKTLRLLCKSNPPLLERIKSGIVYKSNPEFVSGINKLSDGMYSKVATLYHYIGMSRKSFADVENQDKYRLKKLFYALRASVACKWIIERNEIPPVYFLTMIKELDFEEKIKDRIAFLIEFKSKQDESYYHSGELELIDLIKELLDYADLNSKLMPSANGNLEELNVFFRQMIDMEWI